MTLKLAKEEVNTSDDSSQGLLHEHKLPLLGYVKTTSACNLVVYSLKTETARHIWRFGSPIIKFKSCDNNRTNKAAVMLEEGVI